MNIKITSPLSEVKVFESRANAIYAKRMKRTARKKGGSKERWNYANQNSSAQSYLS
jgi:hypothetical protein